MTNQRNQNKSYVRKAAFFHVFTQSNCPKIKVCSKTPSLFTKDHLPKRWQKLLKQSKNTDIPSQNTVSKNPTSHINYPKDPIPHKYYYYNRLKTQLLARIHLYASCHNKPSSIENTQSTCKILFRTKSTNPHYSPKLRKTLYPLRTRWKLPKNTATFQKPIYSTRKNPISHRKHTIRSFHLDPSIPKRRVLNPRASW